MDIKITDQAIKRIGDNIMYFVKEYRNAPSTGTSSDMKERMSHNHLLLLSFSLALIIVMYHEASSGSASRVPTTIVRHRLGIVFIAIHLYIIYHHRLTTHTA
jgi:hypothetical protein